MKLASNETAGAGWRGQGQARAIAVRGPRFLTATLAQEMGILLVLTVGFPFMVHLLPVPENSQLGPRLLPMFWAPLLGCLWGRVPTAVVVAVFAPWLNWALTRHPSPPTAIVMTVQLLVFVTATRLLITRTPIRSLAAVPGYLVAMAVSALVVAAVPTLNHHQPALGWLAGAITMAWPGILILAVINWIAVRFYPPGTDSDGHGPLAA